MKIAMIKAIKQLFSIVLYWIKKIPFYMEYILNFSNPFIFYFIMKNQKGWVWFLIPVFIFVLSLFFKRVRIITQGREEIPVYKRRFTWKENGVTLFKMEDIYEMTTYLNEVENMLESRGYYKDGDK